MNDVHAHAERLLREPVRLADLALAFDETVASTVDVQVEGRNFFPPMLRDISSASSSIHINQFGFPGTKRRTFTPLEAWSADRSCSCDESRRLALRVGHVSARSAP